MKFWSKISNYYKGLFFVMLVFGNFFVYIWPKMFSWGLEGIYAGWIGIWGDWAAHNAYASRFAYQDPQFWIAHHPLYYGTKFTYPFLSNLISGLLMRTGLDRVDAFIIPTLIFSIAFIWLLYKFYFMQLKTYKRAFVAVFIFLTSGGLGFLWYLKDLWNDPLGSLTFPPDQYTQLEGGTIYWLNTITGQLVPQRALLLGMIIGLAVMIMLIKYLPAKLNREMVYKLVMVGCLASVLVVAHMHTFITLFFVCAVSFVLNYSQWKNYMVFGIATAIPAALLYIMLYAGAIPMSFFSWYPGWLANPDSKNMNFIYFWLVNWGLFIPLAVGGFWKKQMLKNEFVISGVVLFVLCNLFLFQPFDWDNSKILTWVYLFWTIPVVTFMSFIWNKKYLIYKFAVIALLVLVSFSGFIDIYRLTKVDKLKILMFTTEDIKIAEEFRKISAQDALVLTSDKHNHWVAALGGRQILLGYRGWMWTYGINDSKVYNDILTMFKGADEAQTLIKRYGIDYIVIGPSEIYDYHANEAYFKANYQLILSSSNYRVYKV